MTFPVLKTKSYEHRKYIISYHTINSIPKIVIVLSTSPLYISFTSHNISFHSPLRSSFGGANLTMKFHVFDSYLF